MKIILPEYHTIIYGNFDLTHILKVKKENPQSLKIVKQIAKDHGLFILGKKTI